MTRQSNKGFTSASYGALKLACFAAASLAVVNASQAGGFAVREQSTSSQGASFAGSAAGGDLSSMYWNPAAVGAVSGMNTESHYALILPNSEITATGGTLFGLTARGFDESSGNIGAPALVGASYGNYQVGDMFIGFSLNAPFGLTTKPDNIDYVGSAIARTSKIFNLVATPTVGYEITPGVIIGAGLQIGYLEGTLKFGPSGGNNVFYTGDDTGFGWTAGVLLKPSQGTSVGVGFRSMIDYELEGRFGDRILPAAANSGFAANVGLETPEIVTVSLRQDVTDNVRFLATYEWTNWSRFNQLDIIPTEFGFSALANGANTLPTGGIAIPGQTYASLESNWEDAWFASVGLEYDYDPTMTFRAGVAYEKSPIQEAANRIASVPDSDRVWLSGGLQYKYSESITLDMAYTHIFIEDSTLERSAVSNNLATLEADVEGSVDIISFAVKMKFGADPVHDTLK